MSPDVPDPTPEGTLIRTARTAAGLKIQQAANMTDGAVSATRWSQIETGREMRRGRTVQARATEGTLARMAAIVGVTAGQLADAKRRDAADVLLEMQRQRRVASGTTRFGSAALSATSGMTATPEVIAPGDLTEDGYPVPPIPQDIDLPPLFDPTSIPRRELHLWLTPDTTLEERADAIGRLRRRRQAERDAAEVLRESNGLD